MYMYMYLCAQFYSPHLSKSLVDLQKCILIQCFPCMLSVHIHFYPLVCGISSATEFQVLSLNLSFANIAIFLLGFLPHSIAISLIVSYRVENKGCHTVHGENCNEILAQYIYIYCTCTDKTIRPLIQWKFPTIHAVTLLSCHTIHLIVSPLLATSPPPLQGSPCNTEQRVAGRARGVGSRLHHQSLSLWQCRDCGAGAGRGGEDGHHGEQGRVC